MTVAMQELKTQADKARLLYRSGQITRKEAEAEIKPYAEAFGKWSKTLAQKYGQRPQRFSMAAYLR